MEQSQGPSRRAVILGTGSVLGAGACGTSPVQPGATSSLSSSSSTPAPTSSTPATPTLTTTASAHAIPAVVTAEGPDIEFASTGRDEVALTFHGQGPAAITQEVLAACAAEKALISVFAVGTWVRDSPAQVTSIAAAGHQIGNHTWSHQQMPGLGLSKAKTEIALGKDALAAAGLDPGWAFRPSGTRLSNPTIRLAAKSSDYLRCISYNVDPEDFLDPGAAAVRSRTKAQVRAGSIISLHLGHAGTAEALPGILTDLRHLGLAPVTLSTLLSA